MKTMTRICICGATLLASGAFLAACDPDSSPTTSDSNSAPRQVADSQIPSLGTASTFAVFGGGGIANQGVKTIVNGSIGTSGTSTSITGFHGAAIHYSETPLNVGVVNGKVIIDTPLGTPADFALAQTVAADALDTYNLLAAIPGGIDPDAGRLGGLTLLPGVYKSVSGSFELLGSDLTLDGGGDLNSIWVFQMSSSLVVGDPTIARNVVLVNGAQSKNVYWQVGSAATINSAGGGRMTGTIIAKAGAAISTPGNASIAVLNGRLLGLFGSVTMVNTVINAPGSPVLVMPAKIAAPHVVVGGTNATDVAAVPGEGFLNIVNNGAHVSATEVGTGTISIFNDGGPLSATNTGNGTMTIHSTSIGAVTVTNTGNGNVSVVANGTESLTLTHTGDEDFIYPASSGILKR